MDIKLLSKAIVTRIKNDTGYSNWHDKYPVAYAELFYDYECDLIKSVEQVIQDICVTSATVKN